MAWPRRLLDQTSSRALITVEAGHPLRIIYTDRDEERPPKQPFALAQVMKWLVEGRFTLPHDDGERTYSAKPDYAPALFRETRQAGEEAMSLFLEEGGSLAKAMANASR